MEEKDKLRSFYDNVSSYLDIGGYDDFYNAMQDENRRQKFFDATSQYVDIGSRDKFNSFVGDYFGQQQPAPRVDVSDVEAQQQQTTAMEEVENEPQRAKGGVFMGNMGKQRDVDWGSAPFGRDKNGEAIQWNPAGQPPIVQRDENGSTQYNFSPEGVAEMNNLGRYISYQYEEMAPELMEVARNKALDKNYKVPAETQAKLDELNQAKKFFDEYKTAYKSSPFYDINKQIALKEDNEELAELRDRQLASWGGAFGKTIGAGIELQAAQNLAPTPLDAIFGKKHVENMEQEAEALRKTGETNLEKASLMMMTSQQLEQAKNTIRISQMNQDGAGYYPWQLGIGMFYSNLRGLDQISSMAGAFGLYNIYEKLDENGQPKEPLTEEEHMAYDALVFNSKVQERHGENITMLNRIGQSMPENAAYVADFVIGSKMGAGVAGKAASNTMQKAINAAIKKQVKTGAMRWVLDKGLPTAARMGANATYRNMLDMPYIYSDAMERQIGTMAVDPETGKAYGFRGGEDAATAFGKAYGARFIDNASELVGEEVFDPLIGLLKNKSWTGKQLAQARKYVGEFGNGRVDDMLSSWKNFNKKIGTGWEGFIPETGEEIVGGTANALFIGDQSLDEVYSSENLLETGLNCFIFGVAQSTAITGARTAFVDLPRDIKLNGTKREASAIIADMGNISTEEIDSELNNATGNEIADWLYQKNNEGNWSNKEREAVTAYVQASIMQKARHQMRQTATRDAIVNAEADVDASINDKSGNVILATFNLNGETLQGAVIRGRVSAMEQTTEDANGNPVTTYKYNPYLSSPTLAIRLNNGEVKIVGPNAITSIDGVEDAEELKQQRRDNIIGELERQTREATTTPSISQLYSNFDFSKAGGNIIIQGRAYRFNGIDNNGIYNFTPLDEKGNPDENQVTRFDERSLKKLGLLDNLQAAINARADEETIQDIMDELNTEQALDNIERSKDEANIWAELTKYLGKYVSVNDEGDFDPDNSDPVGAAGYLVSLKQGDFDAAAAVVDERINELRMRLSEKPEGVQNNGEGVVGMAVNGNATNAMEEQTAKGIAFLEEVRSQIDAMMQEKAVLDEEKVVNTPVSQMEAGTEFPVDWNGTPAVAVVEGRDADGRNLVTVYDANDRDGLPLQAGIEVSENDDAEWEARRVRPQEQQPEPTMEQPPIESAGNGTEQVQPEPQPQPQPEPTPQPTPTPVQPEPAPQQEQPQAEYPKDKQGKPQYDMIDDPNVFLQALVDEWGEDALGALDDIIEDTREGLEQKSKLEQRRINKRLAMLEAVRGMMQPQEEAQEDGTDRTETTNETPIAETPVEEMQPQRQVPENAYYSKAKNVSSQGLEGDKNLGISLGGKGIVLGYDDNGVIYGSSQGIYDGFTLEQVFGKEVADEIVSTISSNRRFDKDDITILGKPVGENGFEIAPTEEAPAETPMESAGEGTEQTEEPEQAPEQPEQPENNIDYEQTGTDTEAVASQAEAVASQAESDAENITTEQQGNEIAAAIDEQLDKVNEQLALLGYYEADKEDGSKWDEVYGFSKTAEKKALKDAENLAKRIAKDLGIDVGRKKLAKANFAPACGDITFRIPLPNGFELYFNLYFNPDGYDSRYGYSDNLKLNGIMFRIENPAESGYKQYVGSNQNESTDVTYDDLIRRVRYEVKSYVPDFEIKPIEDKQSKKNGKTKVSEMVKPTEQKPTEQPAPAFKVGDEVMYKEYRCKVVDVYDNGTVDLEYPNALMMTVRLNGISVNDLKPVGEAALPTQQTEQQKEEPITLKDVVEGSDGSVVIATVPKTEKPETPSNEYGANNKLVSTDQYEELKRRMKEKLRGQANAGFDPEILSIGVQMAMYHIEAGARKFADFAKRMIDDLGDAIRPYLQGIYENARRAPGMEELRKTMDSTETVDNFDVENFDRTDRTDGTDRTDNEVAHQYTEQQRKAFSEAVTVDMRLALERGEKPYKSINDIRKRAESVGMEVDKEGRDDILLQELVEDGLVRAARQVIESGRFGGAKSKEAFDAICKLYEMQPTISMRSSNRVKMQQYSTPLPMAFVADMFAYKGGKVLEPTAGNGMLVFAIPSKNVTVNELDETRLANLREQGFPMVLNEDALTVRFVGKYDSVIANPPFGSSPAKDYDGKMIAGLDEQITLNALSAMKDDGRAAIIIGGNMEYGKNGGVAGNRAFWTYLYDHYNVKGVVDMEGKLYGRQGTTYPTRMILIDGRRSEEERAQTAVYPPVKEKAVRKAESFDDLYDIVIELLSLPNKTNGNEVLRDKPHVSDNNGTQGQTGVQRRGEESDENDSDVGGRDGRGNGVEGTRPNAQGEVRPTKGDSGSVDVGSRPSGLHGAQSPQYGTEREPVVPDSGTAERPGRGTDVGGSTESKPNGETGRVSNGGVQDVGTPVHGVGLTQPKEQEKRTLTEEKLPYRQHNSAFSLESVAPAAMVEAMDKALEEIEKTYGKSIDEFVTEELGYDSVEDMHNALAAEQVDSVAMAIHQMKQGQAMIIGDQTGVGKGRQMAALIRWAHRQGKKPIFVTQKAFLFSDIYRDLVDVGSGELRPFIFNSYINPKKDEYGNEIHDDKSGEMLDADGNLVYRAPTDAKQKKIFESGELPDEYDFAVLTYSQVSTGDAQSREEARKAAKEKGERTGKKEENPKPSPKADFLRKIANDNYMFLDESHTAAGESKSGAYLQSLLRDANAATFASATFAKRPDTMPLYAVRTAMSKANVKQDELIGIIKKGGVTLQEIMSRALTEAGQMVRRERDMSDVKTDWITIDDPKTVAKSREDYDKTIAAFNAIIKFQNDYVKPMIAELSGQLAATASSADVKKGTDNAGIRNVPFASKTYNYTKQLMLALKVDAIVDKVIEEIEAGRHPVIALESTMEASIKEYKIGDVIEEPTFSGNLLRGLDSVMQYTIKDENGKDSHRRYTPKELGEEGERAYYELQDFIRESTKGIFISPLDAIISKLNDKGYKVGELTGRNVYVDTDEQGRFVVKKRTDKDKKRMMREFNSGALDVLILNKSASTGISLHASNKFSDQRQRTMVIAQPLSDINDYMQMIGRIDRTGQVHRGYYINLGLPVPAENRFLMMLSTKLKSLNANTTTSQESESNSVEAPDLLNKYGSKVVVEYLRDNPEIYVKMGEPISQGMGQKVSVKELDDYEAPENDDVIRTITGYVALLSTKEQDEFYNDVVQRYNDLIKYLDDTGTNDLKITVMPLKAKTLEKKVSSKGVDPNGSNPFAKDAYVETVEMDVLRKPMKADDVRKTIEQLNTPKGTEHGHLATAAKEKSVGDRVMEIIGTVQREAQEKLQAENERYEEAKKKAVEDIEKQRAKINKQQKRTEEEKAEAIEKFITDTNAKVEEQHQRNVMKIEALSELLEEKLTWFKVGSSYLMPDVLESESLASPELASPAIFCGYKAKDSKITSSTTFAVFATLDGRRRIEVKLSDNAAAAIGRLTSDNYDIAQEVTLDNWDSKIPTNTRKTGYIMTGNILQAVKDTQDPNGNYPGQLVSYTDEEGNVHDGILMPDKWKPGMMKNSGKPINAVMSKILNGELVKSTDGKVSIYGSGWAKTYTLTVPKTKKEGGVYFENPVILKSVSSRGFWQNRGEFRADINGEDNMRAVVNELAKLGVRVSDEQQGDGEVMYRDQEREYAAGETLPITKGENGYRVEGLNDSYQNVDRLLDAWRDSHPDYFAEVRDGQLYVEPWNLGEGRTAKERRRNQATAERQWRRAHERANDTINKLGLQDRVTILDSTDGLTGKRKKAKGWFDPKTGKIVVVMPNHSSPRDVVKTILHEGVAHYGLRKLVGNENMNQFLDTVFENASEEVRSRIIDLAMDKYNRNFRTATEEYLAGLAEDTNFENPSWLAKVKGWFVEMLHKLGIDLGTSNDGLTDNELRYLLWKSYRNLVADAESLTEVARDAAMQSALEVGNFAPAVAAESMAMESPENRTEQTKPMPRDISANSYQHNNAFIEQDKKFIEYIEARTGIKFKKNQNSNSWYGVKDGKEIRISDHFNKKTDQDKYYFNEDADYIIAKINGTNPFERYSEGDTITHRILGEVEFISYNGEKGYVEVRLKDGSVHKYDEDRFAIPENYDIRYRVSQFQGIINEKGEIDNDRLNEVIDSVRRGVYQVSRISRELRDENETVPAIAAQAIAKGFVEAELARQRDDAAERKGADGRNDRGTGRGVEEGVPASGRQDISRLIKQWAKDNGYWFDEKRIKGFGDEIKGGSESRVFRSKDGQTIVKSTGPYNYDGYNQLVIESMEMFGKVFPNTPYTILGFAEDTDGNLCVVASQPYVSGVSIKEYAKQQGWVVEDDYTIGLDTERMNDFLERKISEQYGLNVSGGFGNYENLYYMVNDLHRGNVIVDANGDVSVIDANISLNMDDKFVDYLNDDILFRDAEPANRIAEEVNRKTGATKEAVVGLVRWLKKFWRNNADYARPIQQMQESIEKSLGRKVRDSEDVARQIYRMPNICEAVYKAMNQAFMVPLKNAIGTVIDDYGGGFDKAWSALSQYLIAKHGLERNDWFVKQGKDEGDYAGLTGLAKLLGKDEKDYKAVAEQVVKDFENAVNPNHLETMWKRINAITDALLQMEKDSGLTDKAHFDELKAGGRWQHYVPLRGFYDKTSGEYFDYDTEESMTANPIKRMRGRTSLAADPLAAIAEMMQQVILASEKNRVGVKFYNLSVNSNSDLLRLRNIWMQQDVTGKWIQVAPDIPDNATPEEVADILNQFEADMKQKKANGEKVRKGVNRLDLTVDSSIEKDVKVLPKDKPKHEVLVYVNGKPQIIYVNGNPEIARVMNEGTRKMSGDLLGKLFTLTRWKAQLQTTYSPLFPFRNTPRDVQYMLQNAFILDGAKGWRVASRNVARAVRAVPRLVATQYWTKNNKANLGKLLHSIEVTDLDGNVVEKLKDKDAAERILQWWQEFLDNGGETGMIKTLDAEQYEKDLKESVEKLMKGGREDGESVLKKLTFGGLKEISRASEDISRFAAYMAYRSTGHSIHQSATYANNATLNFQKKGGGTGAALLRGLFPFINARIRGIAQQIEIVRDGTWAQRGRLAGVLAWDIARGYIVQQLNALLISLFAPDDDDDDNGRADVWDAYEYFSQYKGNNNTVIYSPLRNKFITVPNPQGYAPFMAIGNIWFREKMGWNTSQNMNSQILDMFIGQSPIEISEGGTASGRLLRTLWPGGTEEIAEVITNENFMGNQIWYDNPYNQNDAMWTKAKDNVPDVLVNLAKRINKGQVKPVNAKWDFLNNPAAWWHLIKGAAGGTGRTIEWAVKTVQKAIDKEDIGREDMPGLRAWFAGTDPDDYQYGILNSYLGLNDFYKIAYDDNNDYKKMPATTPEVIRWESSLDKKVLDMVNIYKTGKDLDGNVIFNKAATIDAVYDQVKALRRNDNKTDKEKEQLKQLEGALQNLEYQCVEACQLVIMANQMQDKPLDVIRPELKSRVPKRVNKRVYRNTHKAMGDWEEVKKELGVE